MQKDREPIEVTAYSGYKANERPLHFTLHGERVVVATVVDRWYGTECDYFKVEDPAGRRFLLCWHRLHDRWYLEE